MVTATREELEANGFFFLTEGGKDYGVAWLETEECLLILRNSSIKSGEYLVERVRDADGNFYKAESLSRLAEKNRIRTLRRFIEVLQDPRWFGVDSETRRLITEIAETPKDKNTKGLEDLAWRRVLFDAGDLRLRLEFLYDGATAAHTLGEPERFTKYNPKTKSVLFLKTEGRSIAVA